MLSTDRFINRIAWLQTDALLSISTSPKIYKFILAQAGTSVCVWDWYKLGKGICLMPQEAAASLCFSMGAVWRHSSSFNTIPTPHCISKALTPNICFTGVERQSQAPDIRYWNKYCFGMHVPLSESSCMQLLSKLKRLVKWNSSLSQHLTSKQRQGFSQSDATLVSNTTKHIRTEGALLPPASLANACRPTDFVQAEKQSKEMQPTKTSSLIHIFRSSDFWSVNTWQTTVRLALTPLHLHLLSNSLLSTADC